MTDPAVIARFLDSATDQHGTVREYLAQLLTLVWLDQAGGKRGFTGESDWRYDLYDVLHDLGLIPPWRDGHGIEYPPDGGPRDPTRREQADALIVEAIAAMTRGGAPAP